MLPKTWISHPTDIYKILRQQRTGQKKSDMRVRPIRYLPMSFQRRRTLLNTGKGYKIGSPYLEHLIITGGHIQLGRRAMPYTGRMFIGFTAETGLPGQPFLILRNTRLKISRLILLNYLGRRARAE